MVPPWVAPYHSGLMAGPPRDHEPRGNRSHMLVDIADAVSREDAACGLRVKVEITRSQRRPGSS